MKENYAGLSRKEINDIANLAFISGKTNRQISSKAPIKYLSKIFKDQNYDSLKDQAIPTELSFLGEDDYERFIQARRELIVERLNRLLDF